MSNKQEILLKDIEELLDYGTNSTTIDPALLKYLSIDDLNNIKTKLLEKVGKLKEEDKEWLEQFKKYS